MLANGLDLPEAVREAQDYTWQTLKKRVPAGHGPVPPRSPVLGAGGRGRARGRRRGAAPLPMPAAGTDDAAVVRRARARRLAGLYAVTPDLADTADLVARVEAALAGGAGAIQYRSKSADAALRSGQAERARRASPRRAARCSSSTTTPRSAPPWAPTACTSARTTAALAAARAIVGPERIIGVSCYDDFARAEAAVAAGADYVAFGSFFPSSVKPDARARRRRAARARRGRWACRWSRSAGSPRRMRASSGARRGARGRRDLGGVRRAGRGSRRASDRRTLGRSRPPG